MIGADGRGLSVGASLGQETPHHDLRQYGERDLRQQGLGEECADDGGDAGPVPGGVSTRISAASAV